ncbi:DUF805 domain-containing protein [bacterium]|nr:DUF805 domain-containing protein [bacterium]
MKKANMVSFGTAVRNFWIKYFDYRGRSTRAEYWWALLFVVVTSVALAALIPVVGILAPVAYVFGLAIICPTITLTMRRFRDAGWDVRWYIYPLMVTLGCEVLMFLFAGWRDMASLWASAAIVVRFALLILILFVAVQPSVRAAAPRARKRK